MKKILIVHITITTCFLFISCNNKTTTEKVDNSTHIEESYSNKRDSINKTLEWKELKCGLWINKNNEIGLRTIDGHAQLEGEERYIFITKIDTNSISDIVDTNSFTYIGNNFYTDNNNVYHHYTMADGGYFNIRNDVDYNTFEVINNCYARDKNNIYEYRGWPIENVDIETFKTDTNIIGCIAKDKNHYYQWGDTITSEDMKDSTIIKAIEILNK